MNNIYLSVIIPAFNEEVRIAKTLNTVKRYLSEQNYRSEIIVVDDGSNDVTSEVVKVIDIYHSEFNELKPSQIIRNIKNVGKGFSVACGFLEARGQHVLLTDADMSTPINEVEKLFVEIKNGADLAVGSRHDLSNAEAKKPLIRQVLSFALYLICYFIGFSGVKDTQCGFKLYQSKAAKRLSSMQKIYGFGFDLEHLFLAQRLGYKVKEVPVNWSYQKGSKVNLFKDSVVMLFDLLRLSYIHRNIDSGKS